MHKYIRKYDDFSYEIAPKGPPFVEKAKIYRGDEITISLKGLHLTDEKDPFDWQAFDSFQACFKMFPDSNKEYCATEDNFVLGQSQDALDYDSSEGNPPGTTYDELHFIDPGYDILKDYKFNKVELDIQGKVNDSVYTFMRFKIKIKKDITE